MTVAAIGFVICAMSGRPLLAQTRGCSIVEQNLFVRSAMADLYLWADRLPDLDPAQFASPQAYLEAIRYTALDTTFSYITDRVANDALFSSSRYVGLGFSTVWSGGELRLGQVYPGSPASDAGLRRGATILAVGERSVADLVQAGDLNAAFGANAEGVTLDIHVQQDGVVGAYRLSKRPVTIPTVSDVRTLNVAGRRVGYVFFRNFVEPSMTALDEAFQQLRQEGAEELILDLRYNGGGLVEVARHLGSLVGGVLTNRQVFARYTHNARNAFRDHAIRFEAPAASLTLSRIFVVTTAASASASELVINALRPYVEVVTVGERTYGKPVGQYSVAFCDKVLAPVAFALRNADGQGDYFNGLEPTCPASDDLDHDLGDTAEGLLHEALTVMLTGRCSRGAGTTRLQRVDAGRRATAAGWPAVVGAW